MTTEAISTETITDHYDAPPADAELASQADEARADIGDHQTRLSAAEKAASEAREAFEADPTTEAATEQMVCDQKRVNAQAELDAAREKWTPVFEAERREGQVARYLAVKASVAELRAGNDEDLQWFEAQVAEGEERRARIVARVAKLNNLADEGARLSRDIAAHPHRTVSIERFSPEDVGRLRDILAARIQSGRDYATQHVDVSSWFAPFQGASGGSYGSGYHDFRPQKDS